MEAAERSFDAHKARIHSRRKTAGKITSCDFPSLSVFPRKQSFEVDILSSAEKRTFCTGYDVPYARQSCVLDVI
jgi:hypothetical protein